MPRLLVALVIALLLSATAWLSYDRFSDPYGARVTLEPVASGSFADPEWRGRWAIREGEFVQRDKSWVCHGALANIAVLRDQCAGATAIEFDGEVQRDSIACDLSALWYEDASFSPDGARATSGTPSLKFQIGAYDNSFSGILNGDNELIATSGFTLEKGRRYHVRAEIIYDTMRLLVDGKQLCEFKTPLPVTAGHWAIYSYYPGKSFSSVTVSGQAFSTLQPATAAADSLAAHGLFGPAGRAYAWVADGEGDAPPAALARLRGALCFERAGLLAEADAAWRQVAKGPFAGHTKLNALERRARSGERTTTLLSELEAIQGTGDAAFRSRCARTWQTWLGMLRSGPHSIADLDAFIAAWRAWAHHEPLVERVVVECLLQMRREEDILATFSAHRTATATAMVHMGRGYEALAHCPERSGDLVMVHIALGRFDDALAEAPGWMMPYILLQAGRYEEIERDYAGYRGALAECLQRQGRNAEVVERLADGSPLTTARALCALGRGDEALATKDETREKTHILHRETLIRLGRLDEAALMSIADPIQDQTLDACRAWVALAAGDGEAAKALLQPRCRWIFDSHDQGLLRWLVGPCALALCGSPGGLEERLAAGRAEIGGAYRGILGRQLEAILGQLPADDPELRQPARSWLLVAAIKDELADDAASAATHYAAYLRDDADADPALTGFARWRLTDGLSPTIRVRSP